MDAILGVLFASLLGLLMIPTYMHFETVAIDNAKAATTAQQMQQVSQAAQAYIQANYSAVEANSTASSPATITVSMLQNTGYLPNAFSAANPFGQLWQVQVLQPTPGQLQALVLTQGGTQIGQVQAPMIAAQAWAQGGFVPYNGQYGTLNDTVAHGAYSGWQVSMTGYTNPGPGHLAALLAFNNGNLENNYLYRVAVPGQPQLNTMQTDLNMGNNNINNAQNVNVNQDVTLGNPGAATGGYAASAAGQLGVDEPAGQGMPSGWGGGIHTWDMYANGTVAAGVNGSQGAYMSDSAGGYGGGGEVATASPNGANNASVVSTNVASYISTTDGNNGNYAVMNSTNTGSNPEIYTNGIIDGNTFGGNGYAMYNGSWWADSAGNSAQSGQAAASEFYTSGDVRFQQTGYSAGGSCNGVAVVNGYANGNAGQLLYCQNGQWQAMGGQMYFDVGSTGHGNTNFAAWNLGNWDYCGLIGAGNASNGEDTVYPSGGPYSNGQYTWYYESDGNVNSDDGWICGNYMPG